LTCLGKCLKNDKQ
jgi:hypothetical protein